MISTRSLMTLFAALTLAAPAAAQDVAVPYWAALRVDEVNMRVGPSEEYRISWVYRRAHLPLKVLRLKEGWRLVEDQDGARGWMLARFLTRDSHAVVVGNGLAEMRDGAGDGTRLKWRVEPGVVGVLGSCEDRWCSFTIGQRTGSIRQELLWGAGTP